MISTHTPLTGRDILSGNSFLERITFLLTRPLRDVTAAQRAVLFAQGTFLLTRPLRDVTGFCYWMLCGKLISTHTPLTGRDGFGQGKSKENRISTHTPLTGRDICGFPHNLRSGTFLLTRPLRDVT